MKHLNDNDTERTEITESTEITENTERTQDNGRQEQAPGNADIPCHAIKTLDEAIQFALSESHIAWEITFRLCRALKSMPQYTAADPDDLWDEFNRFYHQAQRNLQAEGFDLTDAWCEFRERWDKVKYPVGQNPLTDVVKRAKQREPLSKLARYPESDVLNLLAGICAELQDSAGEDPLYLGARTAGKLLNVDKMKAHRKLRVLEQDQILVVVERGTSGPHGKATRYRYMGDAV